MNSLRPLAFVALLPLTTFAENPKLPGVAAAIQRHIDAHEIAGAVTLVVTRDKTLDLETIGLADVASGRAMTEDAMFQIMSMTKPVTATAILMLQDEGKLSVTDPVAKFIPEFAALKTPSGKPANLTITQIMTHTSGLGEGRGDAINKAHTLADLIPIYLAAPMQFEPGAQWKYTQSAINTAARLVEIASGQTFADFITTHIFRPLGVKDATHTPSKDQLARVATPYAKNKETGAIEPARVAPPPAPGERPTTGNAGLYTTGPGYARFCQMLLNGGTLDGHVYLSPAAMKLLTTVQTGDLPTGFFQEEARGRHGANYGWGIGACILKTPHEGVAAMLSPGTYGHGGAWGTQAWVDPVKGVAYILMVQRTNFANSDASDLRRDFQQAAADALAKR
jgi:CubicO group peptidase (beta-lactamase class C family)